MLFISLEVRNLYSNREYLEIIEEPFKSGKFHIITDCTLLEFLKIYENFIIKHYKIYDMSDISLCVLTVFNIESYNNEQYKYIKVYPIFKENYKQYLIEE